MSIKGNPVGTTMPRSDWNQNDPKKADFIKNKPDIPVIDITLKQAGKAADAKAVGDALANLPSGGGADWNASEGEAGYVKNRTHYEETTVVNEPLNITWDGNSEGLVSVEGVPLCKVSDVVLNDEQIKTATVTISNGNAVYIGDMWEDLVSSGLVTDDGVVFFEAVVAIIRKDNIEINGTTFNRKGIYFLSYNGAYTASFTTTEPVEHTKTVLKKLDKKFLPYEPIEFIVNEDETSVSCKLSAEELLNISVTELHWNSVLGKEGGVRISPQSVTTGNITTAFATHTVITFVDTYCGGSKGYPSLPVYVVINENGELFYIGDKGDTGTVDLTGYATEDYVDDAISAAINALVNGDEVSY